MKYLILLYNRPEIWDQLSHDQKLEHGRAHLVITADLAATGELVASEALTDPAQTTFVEVRDGRTFTSDGPFAEVKEHLAGFYLIDCESAERAAGYAARMPEAAQGGVEVRPILDLRSVGVGVDL
ncbi:YciI family protein [Dactylosporangium sp. NBC_01737]|uniref:YciI family protein n=1 Tax=Dactylosporangium sp. NBC_01737 TaxID=2975959 RepID=UPI002E10F636|nr:YciI family protein [Dactylosporangium sp. NBC_01737]